MIAELPTGHLAPITSIAFSPDGQFIASGDLDANIRVWDAISGSYLDNSIAGLNKPITHIAFSPDSKRIVISSGNDSPIFRIWDIQSGSTYGNSLEEHKLTIDSIEFNPKGKYLISKSQDSIRTWDAKYGKEQDALSIDGIHFYSNANIKSDGLISVTPIEGKKILREGVENYWRNHLLWPTADNLIFSSNGEFIAGTANNKIRLWDAKSGVIIREFVDNSEKIASIAFNIDNKYITSVGEDN